LLLQQITVYSNEENRAFSPEIGNRSLLLSKYPRHHLKNKRGITGDTEGIAAENREDPFLSER
jgi:hypothetical protein